jgi:hypothetical protein
MWTGRSTQQPINHPNEQRPPVGDPGQEAGATLYGGGYRRWASRNISSNSTTGISAKPP